MRKSKTTKLSDLFDSTLEHFGIKEKYNESVAISLWSEIMGPNIASYTRNVYVKNGIMVVEMNSAIARNQIFGMREAIVHKINERIGAEVLKNLILK